MIRRGFGIALTALLFLAVLFPAAAQEEAKPKRVGLLMAWSLSDPVTKRGKRW